MGVDWWHLLLFGSSRIESRKRSMDHEWILSSVRPSPRKDSGEDRNKILSLRFNSGKDPNPQKLLRGGSLVCPSHSIPFLLAAVMWMRRPETTSYLAFSEREHKTINQTFRRTTHDQQAETHAFDKAMKYLERTKWRCRKWVSDCKALIRQYKIWRERNDVARKWDRRRVENRTCAVFQICIYRICSLG